MNTQLTSLAVAICLCPLLTTAQTYYQACYKDKLYVDFYYNDQIEVLKFTQDSLRFSVKGTVYRASKPEGFTFLYGPNKYATFYAIRVNDHSFVLRDGGPAFSYYSSDATLKNDADPDKRCALAANKAFDEEFKRFEELQAQAMQKEKADKEKQDAIVLARHISSLAPKRKDLAMEKSIVSWWKQNNPGYVVSKIMFTASELELERDAFNQVMRQQTPAVVIYKDEKGQCGIQWNMYGHEHISGGQFMTALGVWRGGVSKHEDYFMNIANQKIYAGSKYILPCGELK
jgi:hypothetical protein